MAALTVNSISWSGFDASSAYAAAAADQEFANDGNTIVHILNTNGSSRTCTFTTAATHRGHPIANNSVTIAATTGNQFVGPFEPEIYNDTSGNIAITWSATAGVTIAVYKLTY